MEQILYKTLRLAFLQRFGSNLFHSITVNGKNTIFEKVMFSMKYNNFIYISGIIVWIICCY